MSCSISASVGKGGVNIPQDVSVVQKLLNDVPAQSGGPITPLKVDGLAWSKTIAAISRFQKIACGFQWPDGRVDPAGKTFDRLCDLGGDQDQNANITATVERGDALPQGWTVVEPASVPGKDELRPLGIHVTLLTRKLVSVKGTSVKWFGVVVPQKGAGQIAGGSPHIFFTPTPYQGGYQDSAYEQFTTWQMLWDDYTSIMGTQLVYSGVPQILVIPFYKNSQRANLGSFLTNWREVVSEVITQTIYAIDPYFLRNKFEFDKIFTSSFSDGIWTHQDFNTHGVDAASMTQMTFDMDGSAAKPATHWRASKMVAYHNTPVPGQNNPVGFDWYVGNRFGKAFSFLYPGEIPHAWCRFLLLHGLVSFG
jgi:hypothetical protein